jgi:hypothetical protein
MSTVPVRLLDGRRLNTVPKSTEECKVVLVTHATEYLTQQLILDGMCIRSSHTANIQVWAKEQVKIVFGPVPPPHVAEVRLCWCVVPASGHCGPTEFAIALLQTLVPIRPVILVREIADTLDQLCTWAAVSTIAAKNIISFVAASVPLTNMADGLIAFGQAASIGIDLANTRSPDGRLGVRATNVPGEGSNAPRLMFASKHDQFPATVSVDAAHNALAFQLHCSNK